MMWTNSPPAPNLPRRRLLLASALAAGFPNSWALPPKTLRFPRDAGSHPDFATEWWYVTGHAHANGQEAALGFQITFFRSRVDATQSMRSPLAARQLVFAHAAVTDVAGHKLWHDQRIARWSGAAPGSQPSDQAWASEEDTNVLLRDWSLTRQGTRLRAQIPAKDFTLQLDFEPTQAVLLQGQEGLSRKGPDPRQASYYYSQPQLRTSGSISLQGRAYALEAGSTAWLDHEWSQEVLAAQAVGWDWIGMNLLDGSALTAFQVRDAQGQALWAGGSFRSANGVRSVFSPADVRFTPQRLWSSPASQGRYPVQWRVETPAGHYTVQAAIDNQELDGSSSTGAIYWEGLSTLTNAQGALAGRGYLEMTGYAAALKL